MKGISKMKKKTIVKFASAGLFLLLFIVLVVLLCTVDRKGIVGDGSIVGLSTLNESVRDALELNMTLYKITQWLGYAAIAAAMGFALLGVYQLIKRKSILKVDREIIALGSFYVLTISLYVFFEIVVINCRPLVMAGETVAAPSFPSSHTMTVGVIAGSAALLLPKYLKNAVLCRLIQAVALSSALFVTVGRLFSGVHWFTDILGGILLAAAILSLFSALLDLLDTKKYTEKNGAAEE